MMKDIPGPLMLQLLHELLSFTSGKLDGKLEAAENDEKLIEMLTQAEHPDHFFFSLLLYQRWYVCTMRAVTHIIL